MLLLKELKSLGGNTDGRGLFQSLSACDRVKMLVNFCIRDFDSTEMSLSRKSCATGLQDLSF